MILTVLLLLDSLFFVLSHWSIVIGHWSLVISHWSNDNGQMTNDIYFSVCSTRSSGRAPARGASAGSPWGSRTPLGR
ncbi:hypothetical protein FBB35_04065 [Nostoc sp. TCL240-02]|nr:hypothetical protein FBB35_04065 [Nostoc sp. TCL240-02]